MSDIAALAEAILGARAKFKIKKAELKPEESALFNGADIWVRELTAPESGFVKNARYKIERNLDGSVKSLVADLANEEVLVVVRAVCNEAGERALTDGHAAALANVPGGIIGTLYDEALLVNPHLDRGQGAAKKNLPQSDAPPSV